MSDASTTENAAIVAFDADTLKKRVADYIQASFGALIPQEVFAAMCDKAVKDFFENPQLTEVVKHQKEVGGYHSWDRRYVDYYELAVKATPFERMVHEAMHERVKDAMKKYLEEEKDQLAIALAKMIDDGMAEGGNKSLKVDLQALLLRSSQMQIAAALNTYSANAHSNLIGALQSIGASDLANRLMGMPANRV